MLVLSLVTLCTSLPTRLSIAPDASATERFAASELQSLLSAACPGEDFTLGPPLPSSQPQVVIGPGALRALGGRMEPSLLGSNETYLIDTTGRYVPRSVVVTGGDGSWRGTMYSVYKLLELLGWRFYAADETRVPTVCPASGALPVHDQVHTLPFEYRDNNQWQPIHNLTFALRAGYNGGGGGGGRVVPADRGGAVTYASPPGMVHTSYALLYYPKPQGMVPPPELLDAHPSWFWPPPSKGGATAYGQLCWSNASLVAFVIKQALAILAEQPDAQILSVSQNDNYARCESPAEEAINEAEGSPMGALLRAVNAVADAVRPAYPHVAIDTLAYQWSRPATKLTRPRPNVIVRLCTIECDFGRPLTHPNNAPFQRDMEGWARISNRTWIWNYVTDFAEYAARAPPSEPSHPT